MNEARQKARELKIGTSIGVEKYSDSGMACLESVISDTSGIFMDGDKKPICYDSKFLNVTCYGVCSLENTNQKAYILNIGGAPNKIKGVSSLKLLLPKPGKKSKHVALSSKEIYTQDLAKEIKYEIRDANPKILSVDEYHEILSDKHLDTAIVFS